MIVYRRCLSCGTNLDNSYRYQNCPACRQLHATEQLYVAQQGGSGYSSGAGADDYDLQGKLMAVIGIFAIYWLWHPVWLIIKFFGSVFFGIGD